MGVYSIKDGTELAPGFEPQPPDDVQFGGGGGTIGGMEARVARLESDMEYVKRDVSEIKGDLKDFRKEAREDFRVTFGVIVFVAIGLAGIMAKGFGWL